MGYKKILNKVTVVFALLLLLLTFFSRTLVEMHLPRVSVAFIQSGNITPEVRSQGLITPIETERIFAPVSGRITQILELGTSTLHGSVLFTITADMRALYDQLDAAHHERRVIDLNIERTQSDLSNAQRQLNTLRADAPGTPAIPTLNLLEFNLQLAANTNDTEAVRESIATLEELYGLGIIPRQQIIDRENDLLRLVQARENINQRREQAIEAHEQALANYDEALVTASRNRDTQIRNQQNIIAQLNFQIRALELDGERADKRIETLAGRIEEGGVYQVRFELGTPTNRLITHISPGLDVGSHVAEGMHVMTAATRNNRFTLEASYPQSQDFIKTNQRVEVTVGTLTVDGTIRRITPQGGRNVATIDFSSSDLRGGELATVTFRERSPNMPNIIPINALRTKETTGYYILHVEAQETRFGTQYFLREVMVQTNIRDARHAAISERAGSALSDDPLVVIVNSNVPVAAGDRVRLVNDP
ncbi:MAG: hypothetical protein FWD90_01470 [Defluviitaleaceae bacterium]|nr:hypothetical protein [Defluviitaleaceae bacterium]